jgi:TonB family protein
MRTISKLALILLLILILLGLPLAGAAGLDTRIDMRLYEGSRKPQTQNPNIITSYYLKSPLETAADPEVNFQREQDEIRRIYNLASVQPITQATWTWSPGNEGKGFQTQVVNHHRLLIQLTLLTRKNHFRVEVIEEKTPGNNKIFESEFNLPQNKTIVFGFEDTTSRTYFISLHRGEDKQTSSETPVVLPGSQTPRLTEMVKPEYPVVALSARVQGTVKLLVRTDLAGRVVNVTVSSGHPLLKPAAVKAVRRWKYEPYLVAGEPRPAVFHVSVTFQIK